MREFNDVGTSLCDVKLKTNGLDKHAKGMSLHLGYFDTASYYRFIHLKCIVAFCYTYIIYV